MIELQVVIQLAFLSWGISSRVAFPGRTSAITAAMSRDDLSHTEHHISIHSRLEAVNQCILGQPRIAAYISLARAHS